MNKFFLKLIISLIAFGFSIMSLVVFAASNVNSANAGDDLVRLLNSLTSTSADFDQVSLGKQQQKRQQISGQMALQKPGKFRWQQTQPSKQLIIANGSYVWIYDVDLEQVTKQKIDYKQPGNPAMLLSGSTATIRNIFTIKRTDDIGQKTDGASEAEINANSKWFELRPKEASNLYQWIRLHFVDNKLVEMQMADNLGQQNIFHFKNVVVNSSISPGKFIFIAPKGVDVIEN